MSSLLVQSQALAFQYLRTFIPTIPFKIVSLAMQSISVTNWQVGFHWLWKHNIAEKNHPNCSACRYWKGLIQLNLHPPHLNSVQAALTSLIKNTIYYLTRGQLCNKITKENQGTTDTLQVHIYAKCSETTCKLLKDMQVKDRRQIQSKLDETTSTKFLEVSGRGCSSFLLAHVTYRPRWRPVNS